MQTENDDIEIPRTFFTELEENHNINKEAKYLDSEAILSKK